MIRILVILVLISSSSAGREHYILFLIISFWGHESTQHLFALKAIIPKIQRQLQTTLCRSFANIFLITVQFLTWNLVQNRIIIQIFQSLECCLGVFLPEMRTLCAAIKKTWLAVPLIMKQLIFHYFCWEYNPTWYTDMHDMQLMDKNLWSFCCAWMCWAFWAYGSGNQSLSHTGCL